MKKITLLIVIFSFIISIPIMYLTVRTYRGLKHQELAELRFFAQTLFDQMDEELGGLVAREEARAIDEYNGGFELTAQGRERFPMPPYVLGYLQSNPDGSFLAPLSGMTDPSPRTRALLLARIEEANNAFNRKRYADTSRTAESWTAQVYAQSDDINQSNFAEKYLRLPGEGRKKTSMRHTERRIARITHDQAIGILQAESFYASGLFGAFGRNMFGDDFSHSIMRAVRERGFRSDYPSVTLYDHAVARGLWSDLLQESGDLQVEIDPLQAVVLSDTTLFVFRRVVLNTQVYCQGVVLKINEFLQHLSGQYFAGQPMARFTNLSLEVQDDEKTIASLHAGAGVGASVSSMPHFFSRPFSCMSATLSWSSVPHSEGRRTLNIMMFVLVAVILLGLYAIFKSTKAVVDLSERRAGFVSAVTHELKTPLSVIRMYIEMLEQGIAGSREREQDYFRILDSETGRLSHMINNVLEFASLEKKQRQLTMQDAPVDEVVRKASELMQEKISREHFVMKTGIEGPSLPVRHDSEALLQVLINLIENSLKFGRDAAEKEICLRVKYERTQVRISVSDTGPGIPRKAQKKVFDNFYRVDNALTRRTGGTGIGLAIVKDFVTAMGGKVSAANNNGAGCTITVVLPAARCGIQGG